MKLKTQFTKDPIYQVALKIDGALDTVAVVKDEGVAEKLAVAYNNYNELYKLAENLAFADKYQPTDIYKDHDFLIELFKKLQLGAITTLAKIRPTCPECTSPFPLPAGLDRCRECEIQDYTTRHTTY